VETTGISAAGKKSRPIVFWAENPGYEGAEVHLVSCQCFLSKESLFGAAEILHRVFVPLVRASNLLHSELGVGCAELNELKESY
jgi:hypothetical protein